MKFVHDDDNCDVANTYLCPGPRFCGGVEREEREAELVEDSEEES